jgi:hypothetical protein
MFGFDGQAATYTVDSLSCTACGDWQTTLAAKLGPSAHATIKLDSVASAVGAVQNFADASGSIVSKNVRVTVTVFWAEVPGRERSVVLGTTRN